MNAFSTLELFNIDPVSEYTPVTVLLQESEDLYDDLDCYYAEYAETVSSFTEGFNIVDKIKKLFELIKKGLMAIGRMIKNIWRWIKSKFSKQTKTVEEVASEAGVTPKEDNEGKIMDPDIINGPIPADEKSDPNAVPKNPLAQIVDFIIGPKADPTSNPTGNINYAKYKNDIKAKLIKNSGGEGGLEITFSRMNDHGVNYTGAEVGYRNFYVAAMRTAMLVGFADQVVFDQWKNIIESTMKPFVGSDVNAIGNYSEIMKKIYSLTDFYSDGLLFKNSTVQKIFKITDKHDLNKIKQIILPISIYEKADQNYQVIMDSFSKYYAQIDFNKINSHYQTNSEKVTTLTEVLTTLNNNFMSISMGLNYIGLSIAESAKVPQNLYQSIDDIETLDKFVQAMINSHFASIDTKNYLYAAASPKLTALGSATKPIWGQTRIVFFPTDNQDLVYKIGFSKYGAFSNIQETKISNLCTDAEKKYNVKFPIAKSMGCTQNNIVEKMQRVNSKKKAWDNDADRCAYALNNLVKKCKLPISFIDIHSGNVSFDAQGNVICYDYGDINYENN